MDTGTPLDTVLINFWDLPPGAMLIALALSVSSFLGFPVELFFYIKLYMILGYRKISRNTVLTNETRNQIYSCIKENPGIIFNDLVRRSGINRGNVSYHINILKYTGKVNVLDSSGNPRYFENSGVYSKSEKLVLKYLRNDKDCRILKLLLEKPELTRNDIGDYIGLTPSTVSWRMKRLGDEEIIRIQKNGKNVRYEINPEIQQYLGKYLVNEQDKIP
ncbi:winged helix-turn-helix transcriptional regulator [Methanolacinia petrolearia]|nr:winged helix-turn-helix transcriptional regulator [Methanolacinia petrolearia]